MKKIKISEVDLINGVASYDGTSIDLSRPFHELFDFENEKLAIVLFKEEYKGIPNNAFLYNMVYTQCLATFLDLTIIEDQTILDEVNDSFYITMTDNIKTLFDFETELVNPYKMSYDRHQKLKLEEDGSYTLDGIECIQSNNRTTNYFRNFLILNDSQKNILMVNAIDGLKDKFEQHQFIKYELLQDEGDASDTITELAGENMNSYNAAFNVCLTEVLGGDEDSIEKAINMMYKAGFDNVLRMPNYHDVYLEVVHLKALKLKKPELLFSELMKTNNEEDLIRGLTALGFKIII